MRRNARPCTRRRHAVLAASQVVAKQSGAVAPSKHRSSCNDSASSREFREFPWTSRNSVYLPALVLLFIFGCFCCRFVIFYWVVQQLGASSNMCEPKRNRFLTRFAMLTHCEKRDIDGHRKVFLARACRQMRRRRPL